MAFRVIIGLPRWQLNSGCSFAENLVRGMVASGHEATLLFTEPGCAELKGNDIIPQPTPPNDLPSDILATGQQDAWGQRWEALERYLEERAPCHYLMLHDWRSNVITPRLSSRIHLVGVVLNDGELEINQAQRLFPYWDAMVAVNERIHFKLTCLMHGERPRIVRIPVDPPVLPSSSSAVSIEMVERFLHLFELIEEQSLRRIFVRPRKPYVAVQENVAGQSIFPESTIADQVYISATVPWPNPPALSLKHAPIYSLQTRLVPLEDHRVLVACSGGSISGVDTFSVHLVRGLRLRGIDARILTRPADQDGNPITFAEDIPLEFKDSRLESDHVSWKLRWQIMRDHLESLSPCIYLPNYDDRYSCITPILSNRVRVLGIAHSDDPWHYEHLCRIGHSCDALVGVSQAITDHLRGLAPAFGSKLETIPYGIPSPATLKPAWDEDASRAGKPRLRIIYTGRLIPRQKRVLDLLAIARALDKRSVSYEMVIVGDGDLRYRMEREAHQLIRERKIWFTGAQPHVDGLAILAMGDVFLLPSAFEGLSVGMLEAMSYGLVPVVSDLRSGVPDIIVPGLNGLVARVGDCEQFANHLQWLWCHPEERRRIGEAAARSVNPTHLIDPMIDRYMSLFQRIVSEPCIRSKGTIVPPTNLLPELKFSTWASRVAANPGQSVQRVMKRLFQSRSK